MSKNNYLDTSSYFRIIDNPDVNDFLSECDYLREPSDFEIEEILSEFISVDFNDVELPNNIISIDSDLYEASIRKELPYTIFVARHYEKNRPSDWRIYAPIVNARHFKDFMLKGGSPIGFVEESRDGNTIVYGKKFAIKW